MIGLGLALVFLTQSPYRGRPRLAIPWYDWLLATMSFIVGIYIAVRYPALSEDMTARPMTV